MTPIDFINLLRTNPEMQEEFCYLKKRTHAYDLIITEFDKKDEQEYMTLSARVFFIAKIIFITYKYQ